MENSLNYYLHTDQAVVYRLPPGQPDLNEPFNPAGENRSRVPIPPVKGGTTCFPDAINLLRIKIGPHFPEGDVKLRKEREKEQALETYREELTDVKKDLPSFIAALEQRIPTLACQQIKRKEAKDLIDQWDKLVARGPKFIAHDTPDYQSLPHFDKLCRQHDEKAKRVYQPVKPHLQKFAKKDRGSVNFAEYLLQKKYKNRVNSQMKIIKSYCAINLSEIFKNPYSFESTLKIEKLFCSIISRTLQFTPSRIHPASSFKEVFEEINKYGPQIFGGIFGCPSYEEPPKIVGSISEKPIYGWSRNAKKRERLQTAHTLVLIGAESKKTQNLIYYIDPFDGSDPKNEEVQRVYVMSYKRFSEGLSVIYQQPNDQHAYTLRSPLFNRASQ